MASDQHAAYDSDDLHLIVAFAGCSLDEKPGSNYVQDNGGLPDYICRIARAIKKTGKSTSQAIAIALSRTRKWAAGADNVDADTRAKSAKAIAEWDKLRAKSKAKTAAKKAALSNPLFDDGNTPTDAELLAALTHIGPCHASATNQILLSIQENPSAIEQLLASAKKRR